jgi:hypothetical protein
MIPAAELILRAFGDQYSLREIQLLFADENHRQHFLMQIRYLLVHFCEDKAAKDIANLEWLRWAIYAFLVLSKNYRYLPDSVMGKVKELAQDDDAWKAILQLYQFLFAMPTTEHLTEQLDSLIEWYAQDLRDASYSAVFKIVAFLRYGDTNERLAEIRKNDALKFVKDFPRLVPVVYRFIKNSGVMELRFWSLFEKDEKMKELVIEREMGLPTSPKDAPIKGSAAALSLYALLDNFWCANPSGLLSLSNDTDLAKYEVYGKRVLTAVTTCSNPSASTDQCRSAIEKAKERALIDDEEYEYVVKCMTGIPQLKNWLQVNLLQKIAE